MGTVFWTGGLQQTLKVLKGLYTITADEVKVMARKERGGCIAVCQWASSSRQEERWWKNKGPRVRILCGVGYQEDNQCSVTGSHYCPTQWTTDTRKEGWSFRGWAWKGKHHPLPPSLSFFFSFFLLFERQQKNSAPSCGLRCLTTKGIFTTLKTASEDTKMLQNGHHSEWLEPFNWEGWVTLKRGSRMNQQEHIGNVNTNCGSYHAKGWFVVVGRWRHPKVGLVPSLLTALCLASLSVALFPRWGTDNSLPCHGKRV